MRAAFDVLVAEEFGPRIAAELREDMPAIDARMIPEPWHNDTCPKWIAEFANGARVYLWAEERDPDAREYVGESRFVVQVYRNENDAGAGIAAVPETSTDDPAELPALIADALAIAEGF